MILYCNYLVAKILMNYSRVESQAQATCTGKVLNHEYLWLPSTHEKFRRWQKRFTLVMTQGDANKRATPFRSLIISMQFKSVSPDASLAVCFNPVNPTASFVST